MDARVGHVERKRERETETEKDKKREWKRQKERRIKETKGNPGKPEKE